MKSGVMFTPQVQVSPFSGFRAVLPPMFRLHWPSLQFSTCDAPFLNRLAGTRAPAGRAGLVQAAWLTALAAAVAHGSEPPPRPPANWIGENSSKVFGARSALLKPPRKRS